MRRPHASTALAAALLAALPACSRSGAETDTAAPAPPIHVQVAKVERQDLVRRIRLPGTVRADQAVRLHARVSGYVKSIVKDRGDRVKAGEVIATLDLPELAAEQAGAKATFDLEDATLKRLDAIRNAEKTAVTDQDMDVARAKRATAEAALKRLETLLAYAEVRAPFDGVVTERFVDPGALVQQGPVVHVVDVSKVRVVVDVPEPEARFVKAGAAAEVALPALPGKPFAAAVGRTAETLDPSTRSLRAEIDAANPDGALRPGLYASVTLALETHAGAPAVPSKAVVMEQGKPVLYLLADGRAKKVPVTTGIDDGQKVEITSPLKGDETVILPGAQALTDGARVEASQ